MSQIEVIGIGSAWVNRTMYCGSAHLNALGLVEGEVVKVNKEYYRSLCRGRLDVFQYAGGSVANTLVALSRLTRSVGFVGKASIDGDGLFFQNDLTANGVSMLLQPSDEDMATSGCLVCYNGRGVVSKVVHLGVSKTLGLVDMSMSDVVSAKTLLVEADILDMPKLHEWLASVLDVARKSQTQIVLVLSNQYVVSRHREFLLELLGCVDIVAGNEVECEALLNTHSVDNIVAKLEHKRVCVIMTRADNGSVVISPRSVSMHEASPCQLVDSTAAGDYYLAGFLHAQMSGLGPDQCAGLGSRLAAVVCGERGSRCSDKHDFSGISRSFLSTSVV